MLQGKRFICFRSHESQFFFPYYCNVSRQTLPLECVLSVSKNGRTHQTVHPGGDFTGTGARCVPANTAQGDKTSEQRDSKRREEEKNIKTADKYLQNRRFNTETDWQPGSRNRCLAENDGQLRVFPSVTELKQWWQTCCQQNRRSSLYLGCICLCWHIF